MKPVQFAVAVAVAGCALAATSMLAAQSPKSAADRPSKPPAFLRIVQVYDAESQEAIVGAQVIDLRTKNSVKTSSTGHFGLMPGFVNESGALIVIRKVGYDVVGPIFLDPTSDTTILIPLTKSIPVLPAVVTTERYVIAKDAGVWAGFETRCSVAHASCIREEAFDTHPSAKLYDFLKRQDGITPRCSVADIKYTRLGGAANPNKPTQSTTGCLALMHSTIGPGLCKPTYYLNGYAWRAWPGDEAQDELETFLSPSEIKGVEVYESQRARPLRFQGDGQCGAVVIWTR